MTHRRTAALACAVLLAVPFPATAAGAATAQGSGYTFTRAPGHGPRGTVVAVRGTGCAYEGQAYEYARVSLTFRGDPDLSPPRVERRYDIAADGTFDGTIGIPDDAPYGSYRMLARCYASDMAFPVGDTDFTVDAPPRPTQSPRPTLTVPVTKSPSPRPTPTRTATTPATPSPKPTPTRPATPSATPSRAATPTPAPTTAVPSSSGPTQVAVPAPGPAAAGRGPLVLLAAALAAANALGALALRRTG